jgi:hypothetical protein
MPGAIAVKHRDVRERSNSAAVYVRHRHRLPVEGRNPDEGSDRLDTLDGIKVTLSIQLGLLSQRHPSI